MEPIPTLNCKFSSPFLIIISIRRNISSNILKFSKLSLEKSLNKNRITRNTIERWKWMEYRFGDNNKERKNCRRIKTPFRQEVESPRLSFKMPRTWNGVFHPEEEFYEPKNCANPEFSRASTSARNRVHLSTRVNHLADATSLGEREDYVTERNEPRVICRLALHKRQLPRNDDEKFRDYVYEDRSWRGFVAEDRSIGWIACGRIDIRNISFTRCLKWNSFHLSFYFWYIYVCTYMWKNWMINILDTYRLMVECME